MRSRREPFVEVIDKLKRLGAHPSATELEPLRESVEQFDQALTRITDRDKHEAFSHLSRQANTLLSDAYARAGIALNVARAAHERAIRDALHPTILSPRSALDRPDVIDRPGPWDGFDR